MSEIDPDQRTRMSTLMADHPGKLVDCMKMIYTGLKGNPKWAPREDDILPETETTTPGTSQAATSTRPGTERNQSETTGTIAPSGDQQAPPKLPKLQYSPTKSSVPGEAVPPKSVHWSIYDKGATTTADFVEARDEALTVVSGAQALRKKYPVLGEYILSLSCQIA